MISEGCRHSLSTTYPVTLNRWKILWPKGVGGFFSSGILWDILGKAGLRFSCGCRPLTGLVSSPSARPPLLSITPTELMARSHLRAARMKACRLLWEALFSDAAAPVSVQEGEGFAARCSPYSPRRHMLCTPPPQSESPQDSSSHSK